MMSLSAGTRVGPYEILARLGAGGMGEVYKARDTRLDRTVALKVLPAALAADATFRERFEREARSISALTHPHICTLYDVGRQNDLDYLVMEYVDGETLAARLARGPLAAGEALGVAAQIVDALVHAHRTGIVHRDLKPGNVMLSRAGAKLLDFGLAKAAAAVKEDGRLQPGDSLGVTRAAITAKGTILGTVQYMAPEQIEGRDADPRSDIWAFGCLLYEMVAGRPAFDAPTPASLIAAILERVPPRLDLAGAPLEPALQRLVAACLEKDPDERFQTMRDVRREIEWLATRRATTEAAAPERPRRWAAWLAGAAAVLLTAVTALATRMLWTPPRPDGAVLFSVTMLAREGRFGGVSAASALSYPAPSVTPDGRRIAFVARGAGGDAIFVRSLDDPRVQELKGTVGTRGLFWSPDGARLAFFAGGKLKSLEFASGRVDVICDAPAGFGGTWGPDGTILFSPSERSPIYRVPAQGGTPSRVTTLDAARHDAAHRWPHWLSDGQHFIFMPWTDSTVTREIQLASIDGGPTRTLFKSPSAPVAAGGYFFYVTDVPPRLAAQAYDPSTFALIGQPFAIVADDNVDFDWMSGFPSASASADTLVYTTGKYRVSRLTWVDRSGRSLGTIGEPGSHFDPRIAPNGRMATFEKYDVAVGSGDVWSADLVRGAFARLTFAPGFEMTPVWSPDGSRLAFASDQGQAPAIYLRKASGAGAEELVFTPEARSYPTDWSSDGRHLLFMLNGGPTGIDVWQYDWERRAASPVVATRFNEGWATFSPDGRWMAYVSDEDQQRQVYVQSYPDGAVKAQVSTRGGASPQWRGDGKELYYLAPDNTMMAVPVQASRVQFTASAPQPLFTATVDQNKSIRNVYAVTPDGQRFLLVSALDLDRAPLVAALNWRALARR